MLLEEIQNHSTPLSVDSSYLVAMFSLSPFSDTVSHSADCFILLQIWMHADENQTGFLNHPAFFNALKLVTLAQSQQELTKDMVKAALHGPAYAKIPPPLINLAAIHAPQPNMAAATPSPPMRAPALPSAKLDPFETLQSPLVNPSTGAQAPQGPSFRFQLHSRPLPHHPESPPALGVLRQSNLRVHGQN